MCRIAKDQDEEAKKRLFESSNWKTFETILSEHGKLSSLSSTTPPRFPRTTAHHSHESQNQPPHPEPTPADPTRPPSQTVSKSHPTSTFHPTTTLIWVTFSLPLQRVGMWEEQEEGRGFARIVRLRMRGLGRIVKFVGCRLRSLQGMQYDTIPCPFEICSWEYKMRR